MPALETRDDIGSQREPVHNLAFAFVTPLGADDDHIRHLETLLDRKDYGQGLAGLGVIRKTKMSGFSLA